MWVTTQLFPRLKKYLRLLNFTIIKTLALVGLKMMSIYIYIYIYISN